MSESSPLSIRRGIVHGGTLVVHGHGRGVVVATGENVLDGLRAPVKPIAPQTPSVPDDSYALEER